MRLDIWMRINKKTQSEFAKELGVSRAYFNRIVCNMRPPSKSLGLLIEMKTNGEVTLRDLLKKS